MNAVQKLRDIDSDFDTIESYIQEINASLFCIDPVQTFMDRSADMGRVTEIQRLMTNLSGIAERIEVKDGCNTATRTKKTAKVEKTEKSREIPKWRGLFFLVAQYFCFWCGFCRCVKWGEQ
ncbi:hypothetical protein FACS1894188_03520 [Clostridia bacterium]|nr:hypothetical protein FACS1894188_03520 [Clostridia bacterium]